MKEQVQKASETARRLLGQSVDAVTQREFQQETLARLAQITEVLVAQHAEIDGLRKRVQALEND